MSSLSFKGDLLKASQVYLALNSNMSASVKHLKTSDSPWSKEVTELTMRGKPCRSALALSSSLKISNFLTTYRETNSSSTNNNDLSNSTLSQFNRELNENNNNNDLRQKEYNSKLESHLTKSTVKIDQIANEQLFESVKKAWFDHNKPAGLILKETVKS